MLLYIKTDTIILEYEKYYSTFLFFKRMAKQTYRGNNFWFPPGKKKVEGLICNFIMRIVSLCA
jgi:hypothetical protein